MAILTLESDVNLRSNPNIKSICLASDNRENFQDQHVTVAGWGTLTEGGSQPSNLMRVDVKVWSNERCRRSYGSSAPGGITKHMLCASDTNKDSCSVSRRMAAEDTSGLSTCPHCLLDQF